MGLNGIRQQTQPILALSLHMLESVSNHLCLEFIRKYVQSESYTIEQTLPTMRKQRGQQTLTNGVT